MLPKSCVIERPLGNGGYPQVAEGVLAAKDLIWGEHGDLNTVPGLTDMITCFLKSIQEKGMQETEKVFFNSYDFKQADRTKGVFIRSALFIPHLMGNN